MITEEKIKEALKAIIDPDFNKDIVSLGFVKNIKIQDTSVSVDIELTTPACPVKEMFRKEAEDALYGIEGVQKVFVTMKSQERDLGNEFPALKNVRSIIAVASCKGGVGKSTVAANIAAELARRGHKTGLLDTDIFGPSVPTLFNLYNPRIPYDQQANLLHPLEINGLKLMSFGFLIGEKPAVMRGPMVTGYIQQLFKQVAWGELEYLILDLPPGTGDIQLTITQLLKLSGAVIVTTRQSLSLVDVAKGIMMFESVNIPMLGIVENMSYFTCDNCDKKHFIFGPESDTTLLDKFGLETLARLPLNKTFTEGFQNYERKKAIEDMVDTMIRSLGKKSLEPNQRPEVRHNEKEVLFIWPDGRRHVITNLDLRDACPCAQCINEYSGQKVIKREGIRPDIKIDRIKPLGNYAFVIDWNDGHSTGIYSYDLLRSL